MSGQQDPGGGGYYSRHEDFHWPLIVVYDIVLLAGLVLNIIIVLVVYISSKLQRSYAWFMFIISWIILSLSYLFLFGQQMGPPPGYPICLAQAVLVYAAPPFTTFSTLVFVIHLYFGLSWTGSAGDGRTKSLNWLLLFPPFIYVSIAVEALLFGLVEPTRIRRQSTGMFCHSTDDIPALVNSGLIGVAVIIILGFEMALIVRLRLNWTAFLKMREADAGRHVSLGIIIRLILFTFAPLFVLVIELVVLPNNVKHNHRSMSISGVLFAVLPLFTALTFGTQTDIIRAFTFGRKEAVLDKSSRDRESLNLSRGVNIECSCVATHPLTPESDCLQLRMNSLAFHVASSIAIFPSSVSTILRPDGVSSISKLLYQWLQSATFPWNAIMG